MGFLQIFLKTNFSIWRKSSLYFHYLCFGIMNVPLVKAGAFSRVWSSSEATLHIYCVLRHFSRVWLFVTLWTVACQAPLSMGFSRQEYWSGLSCPPPGDLPESGIEPESLYISWTGRWVLYHQRHLGILEGPLEIYFLALESIVIPVNTSNRACLLFQII